jgi:hypothetical protein
MIQFSFLSLFLTGDRAFNLQRMAILKSTMHLSRYKTGWHRSRFAVMM